MGATNSSNQKKLYYQLKQKASKEDKPIFSQSEKVGDSWQQTNTFDTIVGRINGFRVEEKDFGPKAGKSNVFILDMEDDNEKFQIQMPHGSLTYSIINTLASDLDKLSEYTIQVYRKESKKDGGTTYFAGAYIKCNDKQIKWKVDPKETPKGVPITKPDGTPIMSNGKPMIDYDDQRLFWENFAQSEIVSKLSVPDSGHRNAPATQSPAVTDTPPVDDDLPF